MPDGRPPRSGRGRTVAGSGVVGIAEELSAWKDASEEAEVVDRVLARRWPLVILLIVDFVGLLGAPLVGGRLDLRSAAKFGRGV